MAPILYQCNASPPVRSVLMTAKTIGLNIEQKEVDLVGKENMSPWFLKLNPQHTVPTFVDDNAFILWDSHAIMLYIVAKYAKDDSLYPKDIEKRAVIDQRLHFDSGTAFALLISIMKQAHMRLKNTVDETMTEKINEVYGYLEAFLEGRQWIAGDSVTIADFCLVATTTSLAILVSVDENKYPKVGKWIKQAEKLPVYEINKKGAEAHKALIIKLQLFNNITL